MSPSPSARFRPGPLAVGLAFLVHPLEEAATDFPLWLRSTLGGELGPVLFALINTVVLIVVTGAVALHRRRGDGLPVVPVAVGTLLLLDAGLHGSAALVSRDYVPGLVTGLLVWAPLGLVLLGEGREAGRMVVGRGVALGVSALALVAAVALLV